MKGAENADADHGDGCRDYASVCLYAAERVTLHIFHHLYPKHETPLLWGKNVGARVLREDVHG